MSNSSMPGWWPGISGKSMRAGFGEGQQVGPPAGICRALGDRRATFDGAAGQSERYREWIRW